MAKLWVLLDCQVEHEAYTAGQVLEHVSEVLATHLMRCAPTSFSDADPATAAEAERQAAALAEQQLLEAERLKAEQEQAEAEHKQRELEEAEHKKALDMAPADKMVKGAPKQK